jgi:hypothetical protein
MEPYRELQQKPKLRLETTHQIHDPAAAAFAELQRDYRL